MRKLIALSIAVLGIAAWSGVATSTSYAASKVAQVRSDIDGLINATWHRQEVMGVPKTQTTRSYRRTASLAYVQWVRLHWKKVNNDTLKQFRNPPHYSAFMCIHHYEGSWQDTGSPFWGGLQMDYGFQSTYGPTLLRAKGTADHWTPLEQIWTAEKAERTRGFWPWPNTARYCGLL